MVWGVVLGWLASLGINVGEPRKTQPAVEENALRQFNKNKFNNWQMSPRFDMPLKPQR